MKNAIVLFSGGLDSTACLYWAKERYDKITLVSFLYGSKEDQTVRKVNKKFSSLLNTETRIFELPFLAEFSQIAGSSLSEKSEKLPKISNFNQLDDLEITLKTAEEVWIPGRNLLFLSIAASLADSTNQPTDIIFGANKEEGTTFSDNTADFVKRMNDSVELGCKGQVVIQAPFVELTKVDIVRFLHENKAKVEFSSSCYQVTEWTAEENPIHCGSCESCQRRKRAYISAKIDDPTKYYS